MPHLVVNVRFTYNVALSLNAKQKGNPHWLPFVPQGYKFL